KRPVFRVPEYRKKSYVKHWNHASRGGQGEGSPPENVQPIDLPKVVVTDSQRHVAFQCHGRNPDVVLRNGRALYLKCLGDPRIDLSSRHIRRQHRCNLEKFVHLLTIKLRTRRL